MTTQTTKLSLQKAVRDTFCYVTPIRRGGNPKFDAFMIRALVNKFGLEGVAYETLHILRDMKYETNEKFLEHEIDMREYQEGLVYALAKFCVCKGGSFLTSFVNYAIEHATNVPSENSPYYILIQKCAQEEHEKSLGNLLVKKFEEGDPNIFTLFNSLGSVVNEKTYITLEELLNSMKEKKRTLCTSICTSNRRDVNEKIENQTNFIQLNMNSLQQLIENYTKKQELPLSSVS